MADGAERRAAQQQSIAAMPLARRVVMVIGWTLAAAVAAAGGQVFVSESVEVAPVIAIAAAVFLFLGYHYVVAPARRGR